MTVGAVTDDSRGQAPRDLSRPCYYGSTRMEKTVHADAKEEWGMGPVPAAVTTARFGPSASA
ncbi:hypothetical protein GCM10009696_12370 [Kocuria himachalensis]